MNKTSEYIKETLFKLFPTTPIKCSIGVVDLHDTTKIRSIARKEEVFVYLSNNFNIGSINRSNFVLIENVPPKIGNNILLNIIYELTKKYPKEEYMVLKNTINGYIMFLYREFK